jgi:hypothetical protein
MSFSSMRGLGSLSASAALWLFSSLGGAFAQGRTVAITVDDLPFAGGGAPADISAFNLALLAAFQAHPDINDLSPRQIEEEIERGEATVGPLMMEAGKKLAFFRFPMNHTGDTQAKHAEIAAFLVQRGYRLATYLAYASTEIDYYAALNKQVFGYEPRQVMLLHDNRLNADVIEQVLQLFEEKRYKFVPLDAAQADAAYRTPDTYITKFGMMWGYRWAKERNVKVNGSLETDPPKWILEYGKASAPVR